MWHHRSWSSLTYVMACCLTAPSHYRTNADFWLAKYWGVHLRAISQQVLFCMMSLKIILFKLLTHPSSQWMLWWRKPSDQFWHIAACYPCYLTLVWYHPASVVTFLSCLWGPPLWHLDACGPSGCQGSPLCPDSIKITIMRMMIMVTNQK